ncbi:histidine kinase [Niastella yeongjuensis]|nr:histidine kinase [Niastella yeongjuensis]
MHDIIFSNQFRYRFRRHLFFWIAYCSYFYIQSIAARDYHEFFTGKPYFIALINLCMYAPFFIGATYFLIYYLMKKSYLLFLLGFFAVYGTGILLNYYPSKLFLIITGWFPDTLQHRIDMSIVNTRWGMVIAFVAVGIKFSKSWYLQQKENLEIIKRKARIEMQLEKANIHPELLLRTLDTIYSDTKSGYNNSSSQILYLSELLSYSLYENENKMVPLQRELQQLNHLIMLENQNKERFIDIRLDIKGDSNNRFIAPMVLVKMLEQSITELHNSCNCSWIGDWTFTITTNTLFSTLSFSDADGNALTDIDWALLIENTRSRLRGDYDSTDFRVGLVNIDNRIVIRFALKLSTETKEPAFSANNNLKEPVYDAS